MGGDEGEGGLNPDKIGFVHPHLNPPPSKGEESIGEILNIFGCLCTTFSLIPYLASCLNISTERLASREKSFVKASTLILAS